LQLVPITEDDQEAWNRLVSSSTAREGVYRQASF